MAYPQNKPTGEYALRSYDFGTNDTKKIPMDEYLFKNGYKNADESRTESVPDAHNANWLYDVLHRNLRYTQELAEENKNQLETKLATPTSIGQVKIGYGLEITSNGVLSVTKSVAEDANIISYDLPVGSYMLWAGNNTPEYFIEPAGQTLLRSSYPELWQFAQDNNLVGKLFGEGDGSTTFTVTDMRGNFISIANTNDKVGVFTQAGIPNITGTVTDTVFGHYGSVASLQGAFKSSRQSTVTGAGHPGQLQAGGDHDGNFQGCTLNFNASDSNSTYGKSNTVTPANWGLKLILKALPTPPSNTVPTGSILTYTGLNAPDGYIIANGAELSRTTFSKLFQWAVVNNLMAEQTDVPNTAHGYYGTGNGTTTFTIPDMRGVFTRWADLSSNRGGAEPRIYQPDGLPNITGYIDPYSDYSGASIGTRNGSGAMYSTGSGTIMSRRETGGGSQGIGFQASRSNSIYGASNFVQPKSVSLIPILKY